MSLQTIFVSCWTAPQLLHWPPCSRTSHYHEEGRPAVKVLRVCSPTETRTLFPKWCKPLGTGSLPLTQALVLKCALLFSNIQRPAVHTSIPLVYYDLEQFIGEKEYSWNSLFFHTGCLPNKNIFLLKPNTDITSSGKIFLIQFLSRCFE